MPRHKRKKKCMLIVDAKRLKNDHDGEIPGGEIPKSQPVSERKILNAPVPEQSTVEKAGNIIINLKQLQGGIFAAACCASCKKGKLMVCEEGNQGWAMHLSLVCILCGEETPFWTSRPLPSGKGRVINRKLTLGMRAIGKGRSAADTLSGFLDLPQPITRVPWSKHTGALLDKVYELQSDARFGAARRLKRHLITTDVLDLEDVCPSDALKSDSYIDELTVDVAVSIDGSWKNRGFKSHHCVTTAISFDTGEVLDTEYLCNFCLECQKHENDKEGQSVEYLRWVITHLPDCPKNFDGSSQAMETEGVRRIYERSNETKLRYTTFIGDGDSKSFRAVQLLQPYGPDVTITKEECLGHVVKRMGTRQRKLKVRWSGIPLKDGKRIGGVGRLTNQRIDSYQFFYRQAIITNKGNPEAARKEIMASLQHYAEGGDHSDCGAWCKRKDGNNLNPVKNPLTPALVEIIKPIFEDLANIELLKHCSMCTTQNANESFHALLWSHAPKEQFNSAKEIMLAVEMARMIFNQGRFSANMILLNSAGLNPSVRTVACFKKQDNTRISKANYTPSPEKEEERRKVKKAKRSLGFKSADSDYQSGEFHSGS